MYRGDFGTACHPFYEWAENHRLEVARSGAAFCSGGAQLRFVPMQLQPRVRKLGYSSRFWTVQRVFANSIHFKHRC